MATADNEDSYGNGDVGAAAAPAVHTSSFLYCEDEGFATEDVVPLFTTSWQTSLLAADESSTWMATHTIIEECEGDPADWTRPAIPPNFVVATVTCHACEEEIQVITAPNALGTEPAVIHGNGVTVTQDSSGAAASPSADDEEEGSGAHAKPGGGASKPGQGMWCSLPKVLISMVMIAHNGSFHRRRTPRSQGERGARPPYR